MKRLVRESLTSDVTSEPSVEATAASNSEPIEANAHQSADDPGHDDSVAVRAYRRFEQRGREHGRDLDDWLEAERELLTSD